jgi:hypothetical protein
MHKRLTDAGIARAAATLGCEVAAVKAVIAVEAAGAGFLPDGRPKILFERHIFRRLTGNRFDASHPAISGPAGGYKGGDAEYVRLHQALQLDGEAAVQSASWGIGQIMGFNWKLCGEKSLYGFLLAVHNDEDAQLGLMVGFIQSAELADELRRKDWAGFARGYNGPAYARNSYDVKLAAAYRAAGGR